jgi:hypothetical protein
MNVIAEAYVKLVLGVGQHDSDYVDAYYGPAEWRQEAERVKPPLPELAGRAASLLEQVRGLPAGDTEIERLRRAYLEGQLSSAAARLRMLQGHRFAFDEESQALYDATAPVQTEAHFAGVLAELEKKLPGSGPLIDRYDAYKKAFVIPPDRLDAVFTKAIDECRARTRAHIQLPESERFTVEYVKDKSWSAYNWYKGDYRSVIQVNTDLPIYIDRALDLACHEGYPGHHVYNALLEHHLVKGRGWIEFSVYPLFSPQSLIAEGTANYGIEVAFPGTERVAFERDALFPLAGLDPARAAEYQEVMALVEQLAYAGNEAARRYLNGEIDAAAAASWLEKYAMMPRPRAEQRVRFFDQYRSYVINYNLGEDLVRAYVERRAAEGGVVSAERRWQVFAELISSPRLPSGLTARGETPASH